MVEQMICKPVELACQFVQDFRFDIPSSHCSFSFTCLAANSASDSPGLAVHAVLLTIPPVPPPLTEAAPPVPRGGTRYEPLPCWVWSPPPPE